MAQKSNESGFGAAVVGVAFLVLAFAWLSIPGSQGVSGFQIASLSFANGILVGWADNLAAAILTESDHEKALALASYKNAILTGERKFPIVVLVFVILGTFLSIGGVIAVLMARSAKTSGEAFKLGFFAEIAEGVIYNIGYYATTDRSGVTPAEVGLTFIAAIIMGLVAIAIQKQAAKSA